MPKKPIISAKKDQNGDKSVSDGQQNTIEEAVEDAFRMAHRVANDMEEIWRQNRPARHRKRQRAWFNNARFVKWFGDEKLTKRQIKVTRRRIHKIRKRLNNKQLRFVIVQHQSGRCSWGCSNGSNPTNAYMRFHRKAIFLCPNWFSNSDTRRAAIIIHELVHQHPFGSPFGRPHFQSVDEDTAETTAKTNPQKARKSPENYEHLYELYF